METPYTYPASDYDKPDQLLALLGSFWSGTFADLDFVQDILAARAKLDLQTHADLLELQAATSRFQVPVYHVEQSFQLMLQASQRNTTLARFDGTHFFGEGGLAFDTPLPGTTAAFPIPPDLRDVAVIANRLSAPSVTLIRGIDFALDTSNAVIVFRQNPFDNSLIPAQEVWSGDQVVDYEAGLWLLYPRFERNTIYEQFGYILRVNAPSSSNFRDLVNAAIDACVQGTSTRTIQRAFSALLDVPLVRETSETVEDLFQDNDGICVVTDQHAYRYAASAEPVVAIGDVVPAGTPLVDALRFYEFNRGQVPSASELAALAVGPGVLASGYFADLVFANTTVPLVVTTDDAGFTKVSFTLGGFPADVEKFWDDVHTAGVARGQTLANLLDQRPNPIGQPSAASLPATINPLAFLCQNVLRDNAFVVRYRPEAVGPQALGMEFARVLRKMIPPQTLLVILVELGIFEDPVTLDGPGDSSRPGYQESVTLLPSAVISDPIDPAVFVSESSRFYRITGACQ